MKYNILRLIATAAVLALAVPSLGGAQTEQFELRGEHVAIYNLVGEVSVEAGSGSAVTVEITRGGEDAGRLSVVTGELRGRETLRVLYPSDRIVYQRNGRNYNTQMRVRDDGTFNGDWDDDDRNRVTISSAGSGLEAHADMRIRVPDGQRISVYWGVGEASVTNVNGRLRVDGSATRVTATGTRGELVIDIGSGSVEVTDAEGEVNIDTGSGSVEVARVRGDALLIDTGSGRVTVSGANVSRLDIDTGSGRITVGRTGARDIRLDTGSGSIDLTVTSEAADIILDTGSGSITVTLPDGFGAEVEIETGSGGIELDMPLTVRRWSRDHVVGTLGNGSGRLVIDTGSGSVTIRKG